MAEVIARGLRFHVQELGERAEGRPTVVLVHGLVMDNLSSLYFAIGTQIAQHAHVVLYDLRGHGMSERPKEGYRVEDMVADLAALLDAMSLSKVHLVGNSFGALVAVSFAATHGDRAASVTVLDGHLASEGWGDMMAATLSLQGDERDRKIAESFKEWLGRHSERKRNRLAENAKSLVYGTSLVADLRASQPLSDASLRAIRCPVRAIYGSKSDILDHGKRLERCVPNCELVILEGASHSVLWERTNEIRELVKRPP